MLDPDTGKYSEDSYIASCLAILPTQDPELIIYVVIENPKAGEHYGGRIAAPVIRDITEEVLPYLNIPRENEIVINHSGSVELSNRTLPEMESYVPDFSGFSKREILPLLARDDIQVIISGEGWVVRQDPPPGTPVKPGMALHLEFE
jgi:cell division protein FtsI (penicillin-binding protein 3)